MYLYRQQIYLDSSLNIKASQSTYVDMYFGGKGWGVRVRRYGLGSKG
jgi:hypothetical protein